MFNEEKGFSSFFLSFLFIKIQNASYKGQAKKVNNKTGAGQDQIN